MELGFIYSLVVLALFISFTILNIADLSTDGCFTLGCAVAATVTLSGHPLLALLCAVGAGVLSGFITAFLQTRMGVESILAGIIVNTGLYTINIAVMGFSSNVNLFKCDTVFTVVRDFIEKHMSQSMFTFLVTDGWYRLIEVAVIVIIIGVILSIFLGTRLGLSIRATGDNAAMVKASSINPKYTITVGLCVSSALTLVGKGTMFRRILGVIFGSCLYRFIVAVAIRVNVPAECLKLVSALIVAVAIAFPYLKKNAVFAKQKYSKERIRQRKGGAC